MSTPSPVLIGDTTYLFTDVAQNVSGDNWMQVALHQFKSYGNINKWHHDSAPIHTRSDFSWTNGNYLAEIGSITPLLDGNRLRIWYGGHNISEIDPQSNDTTNHVHFIGDELHVDSSFWGIETSEYVFSAPITAIDEVTGINEDINIQYYRNKGLVETKSNSQSIISVYSINGELLYKNTFTSMLNFSIDYDGLILINVTSDNLHIAKNISHLTE